MCVCVCVCIYVYVNTYIHTYEGGLGSYDDVISTFVDVLPMESKYSNTDGRNVCKGDFVEK